MPLPSQLCKLRTQLSTCLRACARDLRNCPAAIFSFSLSLSLSHIQRLYSIIKMNFPKIIYRYVLLNLRFYSRRCCLISDRKTNNNSECLSRRSMYLNWNIRASLFEWIIFLRIASNVGNNYRRLDVSITWRFTRRRLSERWRTLVNMKIFSVYRIA